MNAIVPQFNVGDIERMARGIAGSKLFGITTPEQALALCLVAQAEGRHPASAAQDYHIIQGRPAKKSDAMLRDFLGAGGKVSEWVLTDEHVAATFSHPAGGSVRIDWDLPRAIKAGINTPMWKKYPRQMLRARVVSEGVRTVFPMATSGMYVPEEVQDFEAKAEPRDVTPEPSQVLIGHDPETGEVAEEIKPQSKAKSRNLFGEMVAELRACQSLDDLTILWRSKPFKDALKSLPLDWQTGENSITAEKDSLKADFLAAEGKRSMMVPPSFDDLEPRPDDSPTKAKLKVSIVMETAANAMTNALSPEGVKDAWDANVEGKFDGEALSRLTDVYEAALRQFGVSVDG